MGVTNLQPNNAGGYSVAVSNPSGTTTSTSAILTLGYAPVITMQPRSRNSEVQTSVTFKVVASGTPSPSYQWRFNGMSIGDATMATYTIDNVRPRHAGSYSVVVRNSLGAVTSATVKLTVQ